MASEQPPTDAEKHNSAVLLPLADSDVLERHDMTSGSASTTNAETQDAAVSSPQVIRATSDDKQSAPPVRELTGLPWFIVNMAVLSATFLYALDNTVTATVRPSMIESLGNRMDMLTWLSISYPMGEVGSNPLWGKLSGQFNNKILYLGALFIFEVGSAVIGSAQSIEAAIVGRAIAGVGGSGIYVGTVSIISAMTTPIERNQYLNFVGISWSVGTILGPIVGGAFADSSATWRWAFYVNICIAALAAPACVWLVPTIHPPTSERFLQRIRSIDFAGAVLFLGGVVSIMMILGFGGAIYDWNGGQMIGLYVAAGVIWIAFALQQRFHLLTKDRIFPVQLVSDWSMVGLFAWNAVAISNVVVTVYSLPLFFQFTFNDSALMSGVYTLPFVCAVVVGGGATTPVFVKFPVYKAWFAGAAAIMLIGNGLLSTTNHYTPRGTVCGYTVIQGIAIGAIIQMAYTVGQTKVQKPDVPSVTAFLTCAQMAGLALSLGIATSVFLLCTTADISAIIPGASRPLIQATIEGARTSFLQTLSPDTRLHVLEAIGRNIGRIFYLNIAGAALGLVIAVFMKRERLKLDHT